MAFTAVLGNIEWKMFATFLIAKIFESFLKI